MILDGLRGLGFGAGGAFAQKNFASVAKRALISRIECRPVVPATPLLAVAVSPKPFAWLWQEEQEIVLLRDSRLS